MATFDSEFSSKNIGEVNLFLLLNLGSGSSKKTGYLYTACTY